MNKIKYKKGYRFQIHKACERKIPIIIQRDIRTRFISMSRGGLLRIEAGYAYDGPSRPAIRTKNFMRGALYHDALYELMRKKLLDATLCRAIADQVMVDICQEDGMCRLRRWWVKKGVRSFGGRSTRRERKIHTAP